eukprot:5547627-Amphidinium_carterae.1
MSGSGPAFTTFLAFLASLDQELEWWTCPMELSDRLVPFLGSERKVRVIAKRGSEAAVVWSGSALETNCGGDAASDDDAADDEGDGEEDVVETAEDAAEHEEDKVDEAASPKISPKAGNGSGPTLWLWCVKRRNSKKCRYEAERLWAAVQPESLPDDSLASSSSSSSSTESSSTSSGSVDSEEESAIPHTEQAHVRAKEKHTITATTAAAASTAAASTATAFEVQRDRQNHVCFGKHFYSARFRAGNIVGYHFNCRHPGHERCSKELSVSVGGSLEGTRQILKAWCVLGAGMGDRTEHMHVKHRNELVSANAEGRLLPETDLDMLADTIETVTPFRF